LSKSAFDLGIPATGAGELNNGEVVLFFNDSGLRLDNCRSFVIWPG